MQFMEDSGAVVHDLFSAQIFVNIDICVTIREVFRIMRTRMDYTPA